MVLRSGWLYLISLFWSGWPSGDPSYYPSLDLSSRIQHFFYTASRNFISQPQVLSIPSTKTSSHSFRDSCLDAFTYLINEDKSDILAEIDFSCISGTFLSSLPRFTSVNRLFLLPCSNNLVFQLPKDVSTVLSPTPKLTVTNRSVIPKSIAYTPLISGADCLHYLDVLNQKISNDSLTTCIIVSNYHHLVTDSISKNLQVYRSLQNCNALILGKSQPNSNIFYKNLFSTSVFFDFIDDIDDFYLALSKSVLNMFTLIPYGFSGMSYSACTSLYFDIPVIASSTNDASSLIEPCKFSIDIQNYTEHLQMLVTNYCQYRQSIHQKLVHSFKHNQSRCDEVMMHALVGGDQYF